MTKSGQILVYWMFEKYTHDQNKNENDEIKTLDGQLLWKIQAVKWWINVIYIKIMKRSYICWDTKAKQITNIPKFSELFAQLGINT